MSDVLTLGESLALIRTTTPGRLRHQATAAIGFGGAESNVAIGLARLGHEVGWLGRVGVDEFGELISAGLRGEGVDAHVILDRDHPTALMVKSMPTAALRRVTYYRKGSAGSHLTVEDLEGVQWSQVQLLHVSGITCAVSDSARATVFEAVARAKNVGAGVSFDVNHRNTIWSTDQAAPTYSELAEAADVLIGGVEELALLGIEHHTDEADFLHRLAKRFDADVVLKKGTAGASSLVDGSYQAVEAVPVDVVDTVGAGDAFVAGYLSATVDRASATERLTRGAQCGAWVCTSPGDWEGAPTRADLHLLTHQEVLR